MENKSQSPIEKSEDQNSSSTLSNSAYAGFWKRFLAYFVDNLIIWLVSLLLGFTIRINSSNGMILVPGLLISAAYFIFFWMRDGQTLGNRLLAIKVVREDGQKFDFATGIIRYISYLISGIVLWLGFLWIIWDKKKQGWHDKIAKTVVVKTEGKSHTVLASFLVILPLIFIIIFILAFGALGIFLFSQAKKHPEAFKQAISQNEAFNKILPTLSEEKIDRLADRTFVAVNDNRLKKGLPELTLSRDLCAYAQRRLEQLTAFGKFDDNKGLIEDASDSKIWNTYFSDLKEVNDSIYDPLSAVTSQSDIANYWATGLAASAANNKNYTQGCVRGKDKFMVLIAGESK